MKGEAGYTLVEMLAALTVISLAFAGLGQGLHVLGRYQQSASSSLQRNDEMAKVQEELSAMLAAVGAGDIIATDARRLEFRCAPEDCRRKSRLAGQSVVSQSGAGDVVISKAVTGYGFRYQTTGGFKSEWSADSIEALTGIALVSGASGSLPAAFVRIRKEQNFRCDYDVVIASCRTATP